MAKINKPSKTTHVTHEGAPAKHINAGLQLRRTVMACLLWEDAFYESGESIADRIIGGVANTPIDVVHHIAVEARNQFKLRHVPLLLARELARRPNNKLSVLLPKIIQRADELAEFMAIYWKDGKTPIAAQVKKGLAKAFPKFNAYSLAKYNRDGKVKLRDVMFMTHPKPKDAKQEAEFKALAENTLETPDTWEVALSAGKDKAETFRRLMAERNLGGLAFLRNLRNMEQAGITIKEAANYASMVDISRILPFRFISAANAVPKWEPIIEEMMIRALSSVDKFPGKTVLVVDNSGSMYGRKVSARSEIDRSDAACALAILLREICEEVEIISYSTSPVIVAPRRGFALRDVIQKATSHGGTDTKIAIDLANTQGYDRIILITDEQSRTPIANPLTDKGYVINVASYQNGIGYGKWNHIDGFSETVIDWVREFEKQLG